MFRNSTIVMQALRAALLSLGLLAFTQNAPAAQVPPKVRLVSPGDNASYATNTPVTLKAKAWDKDGSIRRVRFYENGSPLGTDTTGPYVFRWNNASVGTHDIYAVAIDNTGLKTKSAVHRIYVSQDTAGSGSGTGSGTGAGSGTSTDTLVVYPADQATKNRFQSDRFAVRLSQNGATASSFVYKSTNNSKPAWAGTVDYMQAANHWTTFSFADSVDVEASRLDGKAINTCIVRPLSLNIQTSIQGNTCSFTLDQPARVSVEIDETRTISANFNQIGTVTKQIVKNPLFVFAEPLETNIPKSGTAGVLYFGPGIHNIGKQYPLANNTQVYIAGGAYVIGTFKSAQSNPKNISIRGRGILSAIGLTETAKESSQWGNHSIDFSRGTGGSNLSIEGITITDPLRACIISYSPIHIQRVKLMSWEHRNDGITAGNKSVVEDNFIKVQDDNIKLYYSNQVVRRNVIWQQTGGGVFKLAWSLSGTDQGNQVSDIDIIHSDVFNDYSSAEPDRPDMHSTSAIFSSMGFNKNASFRNGTFKNIRIEEKHLLRLMSLRMVTTHKSPGGTSVWGNPSPAASKQIDNLTFQNVELPAEPYKESTLYGNAGGTISNLKFVNLSVGGQVVTSGNALGSRNDGSGLSTAGKVSTVTFSR